MKYTLLLFVAISFLFVSCEDASDDLGFLIQPSKDKITIAVDSFHVQSTNLFVDSIYARGNNLAIGNITDNVYGDFNADFLSQFKFVNGVSFPSNSTPDSLSLVMYYKNFWGDSLASQDITVYQLSENLNYETNYYSNINVAAFCNKQTILGQQTFTAKDPAVSDSIRKTSSYRAAVRVVFPTSLRDEFFSRTDIYTSQAAFLEFFKGVYATIANGNGSVLLVDSANIELNYHYTEERETLADTIIQQKIIFPAKKEIASVARFEHPTALSSTIATDDSIVYLHSPAGVFTKIEIPFERILDRIPATHFNTINHVRLVAEAAVFNDDNTYTASSYLLLIREQDIEKFFAQSLYPATSVGIYAFLGTYNSTSQSYTFASMTDYMRMVLQNEGNNIADLNDFVLIPVNPITNSSGTITGLKNLYSPTGVRLRSGSNTISPMRIEITHSQF